MDKPEKQLVRIAFDPGWFIDVDDQTNELEEWDISTSLIMSGSFPSISQSWEELKIFLDNYNIVPKWIKVPKFDKESGERTAGPITTVRSYNRFSYKTFL